MSNSPTTINVSPQAAASPVARGVMAVPVGVQPSTLSIAVPVALARLGGGDLQISPIAPQFLQTASDVLGNFGEGTDGFDALMAIPIGSFDDDVKAMGSLDQNLIDADFTPGEIDADTLTPVGNDLIAFTKSGDAILGTFNGDVTPVSDPGTPPPPDPGSGGGGDGSGGGGGGGGGSIGGSGGGGAGGGPSIRCTLIVNPLTNEVVGQECETVSLGGPGIHVPLQE